MFKRGFEMKIVVSVERPELDAPVDGRFGRAPYFLLVDSDTMGWEAVENSQNLSLSQGAGIQAAQQVVIHSPDVVLTGNCGPKAFRVLEAGGAKVCVGVKGTAREAVEAYLQGRYTPTPGANVEGHWM
jgi:predicted Fe-Mo cluster-binding NifX family protein